VASKPRGFVIRWLRALFGRKKSDELTLRGMLDRLTVSERGRVFICNLEVALREPCLDLKRLGDLLREAISDDELHDREDEMLGRLRREVQHERSGAWLKWKYDGIPPDFAPAGKLFTVMTMKDYYSYYSIPGERGEGYDFPEWPSEARLPFTWKSEEFRPSAGRGYHIWVAPTNSYSISGNLADRLRDLLGLVHRGSYENLVVMEFTPPSGHACFRPLVFDAVPNQRFLQTHPNVADKRFGRTVDLMKLEVLTRTHGPNVPSANYHDEPLEGLPELVLDKVLLSACTNVRFYYIGRTEKDRATKSADELFARYLERGRPIRSTLAAIRSRLDSAGAKP